MTDTARTDDETREYLDNQQELDKKVTLLAKWIKESSFMIGFTGAGISTACGIPDFRSGTNTILDTGTGKWARQSAQKSNRSFKKAKKKVSTLKAIPSKTHMSFVKLCQQGILKGLISQNTDGLHRRSGFPQSKLAELHGNGNLETCKKCGKQYLRDFRCRNSRKVKNHETGRICTVKNCGGKLLDTIINFGETLPEKQLDRAEDFSNSGDLCISMGSSLTVTPAADFPRSFNKSKHNKDGRKKHVIINLQKTPLTSKCHMQIYGKCDDVMVLLMKKLNITIPVWNLTRYITVTVTKNNNRNKNIDTKKYNNLLTIQGIDPDYTPCSIFRTLKLTQTDSNSKNDIQMNEVKYKERIDINEMKKLMQSGQYDKNKKKPISKIPLGKLIQNYTFGLIKSSLINNTNNNNNEQKDDDDNDNDNKENNENFILELGFNGHYNEPELKLPLNKYITKLDEENEYVLQLRYNPFDRTWKHDLIKDLKSVY